jgi:hypothetical protein
MRNINPLTPLKTKIFRGTLLHCNRYAVSGKTNPKGLPRFAASIPSVTIVKVSDVGVDNDCV